MGGPGPVEGIVGFQFVVNVRGPKVKPVLLFSIPRQPQDLHLTDLRFLQILSGIHFHHVLLQGFRTKNVFDLKLLHLAVWAFGPDEVLIILHVNPGFQAVVFNRSSIERGFHRPRSRQIHGEIMV